MNFNKYLYLFVVQGHYEQEFGWEDVWQSENYKETQHIFQDYLRNEPYPHRIIKRRELNPEWAELQSQIICVSPDEFNEFLSEYLKE